MVRWMKMFRGDDMYYNSFVSMPRPIWVDSHEQALGLLGYLNEIGDGPVAIDTETTGVDRERDTVIIWSLSDGRRRYVINANCLQMFEPWFQAHPRLVFHNANFDTAMLRNSGVDLKIGARLGRRTDTMVMHHWLNQDYPHSLAWIAEHELGMWKVEYQDVFGKAKRIKGQPAQLPIVDMGLLHSDSDYFDKAVEYASLDAYLTYLAYLKFDNELERTGLRDIYYKVETKFMDVIYLMERRGVRLDEDKLRSYMPLYEKGIGEIEGDFNRKAGRVVNLNSVDDLRKFFYDECGYTSDRKSEKTGKMSTDVTVLQGWASEGNDFAKALLRYRNLRQQYNLYVIGMLERAVGGRIHTTYTMSVADTGRLSSTDPNLQNIVGGKKIQGDLKAAGVSLRSVFTADPGCELYDADYSQLEMCIGAHMSSDQKLIDAIVSGKDLHSLTASALFNKPYEYIAGLKQRKEREEKLSAEEKSDLALRDPAKTINFGVFYGMGADNLAAQINLLRGSEEDLMTREEAQQHIDTFFSTYPGVQVYVNDKHEQVHNYGFVTTILGRKRFIEGARSYDRMTCSGAFRKAVNTPIQGSAADVLRCAMIRLEEDRVLRDNNVHMNMQIHDELVFNAPKGVSPDVQRHLEEIMSSPFESPLKVPLTAKLHAGDNWATAKK
jgi:DNA polymerase-1